MATFSFDDGSVTLGFSTICALRMRVSISAIGSLMLMNQTPSRPAGAGPFPSRPVAPSGGSERSERGGFISPARLDDARDIALERQIADLVAPEAKLAERAARATSDAAAVAVTRRIGIA